MAQQSETIYQKIWGGKIPSYPLHRFDTGDGNGIVAILDIFPAGPGHTLITSEHPYEKWLDVPPRTIQQAAMLGWFVGQRLDTMLAPSTVHRFTLGDQVPHFHEQFIPSWKRGDTVRSLADPHRMDAPLPKQQLEQMWRFLAFPAVLGAHADEYVASMGAMDADITIARTTAVAAESDLVRMGALAAHS
jgi:histidine triad (HIT) family protein